MPTVDPRTIDTADTFADEGRRLAALHALALLDSEPEREFDALVALAAQMLNCQTALLSLVDRDRLWIKADSAGDRGELPREVTFCNYTIRGADPLVIDDVAGDPRFAANPLVAAEDGVRFYAGAPIHAIGGDGERQAIGALCVLDTLPRSLNDEGRRALTHLATLAETMIAARAAARRAIAIATTADRQSVALATQDRIFRQAERMAAIGSWRLTISDQAMVWSEGVFRIHGLPDGAMPPMDEALDYYPAKDREIVVAALADAIETGRPFDIEIDFRTAQGEPRRVRTIGELEHVDGVPVALVGVCQDVTQRYALEVSLRRSADTDALTGIANRAAFDRALDTAMTRALAADTPLLLALVDLDGFKAINDTLGHTAGDDVLRGVGRVLQAPWLLDSVAARIGGDEFAVIVENPCLTGQPEALRLGLEEALRFPIAAGGLALVSAGTVGIAALDRECVTIRDFVHRADTILYTAKRARIGERRRSDRRNAA